MEEKNKGFYLFRGVWIPDFVIERGKFIFDNS
jgi:hypothetical protein